MFLRGFSSRARTNDDILSHEDPCGKTLVALTRLRLQDSGLWWRRLFGFETLQEAEQSLLKAGIFKTPCRGGDRVFLREKSMREIVCHLVQKSGGSRLFVPATICQGFARLSEVIEGVRPDCLDLTLALLLTPLCSTSEKELTQTLGRPFSSLALFAFDKSLEEEWLWRKSLLCTFYAFFVLPSDATTFSGAASVQGTESVRMHQMLKRAKAKMRKKSKINSAMLWRSWKLKRVRRTLSTSAARNWLEESFRGSYRLNSTVCLTNDGRTCNLQTYMADRILGETSGLSRLTVFGRPDMSFKVDVLREFWIATDLYERYDATAVRLCEEEENENGKPSTTPQSPQQSKKHRGEDTSSTAPTAGLAAPVQTESSFVHAITGVPLNVVCGCPCADKTMLVF